MFVVRSPLGLQASAIQLAIASQAGNALGTVRSQVSENHFNDFAGK